MNPDTARSLSSVSCISLKVRHNQKTVQLSWAGYIARMAEIINVHRVMQYTGHPTCTYTSLLSVGPEMNHPDVKM